MREANGKVKADAIDIEQDGEESKRAVGIVSDDLNVDKDSANNGSESGDSIDNGSDSGDSIINDCHRFCKFQFAA